MHGLLLSDALSVANIGVEYLPVDLLAVWRVLALRDQHGIGRLSGEAYTVGSLIF